jgi:hypothetical protein
MEMREKGGTNVSSELIATGSRGVFEAALRWQQELMRFMGRRMAGYVELGGQLPQCRSPSDLLEVQTRFIQQMLADYRSEAEWIADQFPIADKPVQKQIDRAFDSYEDTLLKAQRDAAKIIDLAKDQAQRIVESAQAQVPRKAGEQAGRRNKKAASH